MKTKNTITSLRILATLGLGVNFAIAAPIYVDQESTSMMPEGSSWRKAYKSLDDALNAARDSAAITEIRVAKGTYTPRSPHGFALIDNVNLLGGYGGSTSSTPFTRTSITTLSGDIGITGDPDDNCFHVLIADGYGDGAMVEGFTITNGNADGIGTSSEELGGGMFISNAAVIVRNCTFKANQAKAFGGGAAVLESGAASRFEHCTFCDNEAGEYGGGLYNGDYQSADATPLTVLTSRFAGNRSGRGGGIYNNSYAEIRILNSGFSGNEADSHGGAIYINEAAGECLVGNCSILQNSAGFLSSGLGGGIAGNFETRVYNSLIWYNTGSGSSLENNIYLLSGGNIRNCCIGGWVGGGSTISSLPRVVGLAGTDGVVGTPDDRFQVRATSPLINAGNDSLVHADIIAEDVDLGGRDRFNGTVDIGAMEY